MLGRYEKNLCAEDLLARWGLCYSPPLVEVSRATTLPVPSRAASESHASTPVLDEAPAARSVPNSKTAHSSRASPMTSDVYLSDDDSVCDAATRDAENFQLTSFWIPSGGSRPPVVTEPTLENVWEKISGYVQRLNYIRVPFLAQ